MHKHYFDCEICSLFGENDGVNEDVNRMIKCSLITCKTRQAKYVIEIFNKANRSVLQKVVTILRHTFRSFGKST